VGPGTPGRGGGPVMPNPTNPGLLPFQRPGAPGAGATRPLPTGLLGPTSPPGARTAPAGPTSPAGAPAGAPAAPRSYGGLFDPGSGDTSAASMVAYFNSLPTDAAKANFVRAIDQYGAGRGGAANLGAGLQSALRQSMGQSQFDNWSATNIGAQPGVITADGLPAWLVKALS
jgi:hypothetical protein